MEVKFNIVCCSACQASPLREHSTLFGDTISDSMTVSHRGQMLGWLLGIQL